MDRILVIEDDPDIALSLKYLFDRRPEFRVVVAHDGEAGLRAAERDPPDLVLLDLNLPRMDGVEVCRQLRASRAAAHVPILILTARAGEANLVAGLESGADDYVVKPFSSKELVARVRALLRRARTPGEPSGMLAAGPLQLDEATRRVRVGELEIALTRKEFDLLADLLKRRGRVVSREQLLERVWGYEHPGATRTVDVHVRQLRRKLGADGAALIETVVGVGYRIRSEP